MKTFVIVSSIFFALVQTIVYFSGIPYFWKLFFAIYVLYFSLVYLVIYLIGFQRIRGFFDNRTASIAEQYNPLDNEILAAILVFVFVSMPFLFVISYSSSIIFIHHFGRLNDFLQRPWPNVFLQLWTAGGIIFHLWKLTRGIAR